MTFFYDLNKRMAELSQKQTLAEGAVAERATGDYSATKARAGKDIGKPGKNFSKIAADAGQRYGSKAAGQRVAGAVLNKLRHPKESQGMTDEGNEFSGELVKAKANHQDSFKVDGRTYPVKEAGVMDTVKKVGNKVLNKLGHGSDETMRKDLQRKMGVPATGKKPNFADKIAGAKKEVDEMLGDVAAEAIKGALSPKQKKINKNGRLDANDFAMLRKGGKKQVADEGAGQFYVYHKTKGDRAGGADYDLLKTFPDKDSATSFAQKYNNKISADKKNFHSAVVRTKSVKKDMDEGFDDMERDVKRRLSTPKVGDVKRGARHDIETTATGIRATRRNDDETDDQPTGEKRGRGRPKSSEGPRQERTTAKSRKADRTAYSKKKTNEDDLDITDRGEYDQEGEMAKDSIKTVVRHAQALEKILGDNDNLPEWVQAKLAKIEGMMTAVDDYMQNQESDDEMAMDEEKTAKRDNRAERAGRKVTKDIEYDEKKKDGIHGAKRGSEDDRAEKAGKKVAKDIEYDEKKKEKKVDETTTSGSVATGGGALKSTKGGVQIGKGIYDSVNRDVERLIAESMSINVSMTNDDNGAHKNITVTAADEDAEMLAQLLARAGLGGGMSHDHGHEEPCPECGSTDCGCDENMAEAYGDTDTSQNQPDWPTDTEYSDDAMQYSGGLNKPKTDVAGDGQTTVPVTAVHTQEEDELRRLREMAGIKQQELKPWERTMKEAAVEEGVVDAVKGAVKKGLEKLGHGSDEEMRKDLQKKMGVPATGEKPKDDKKMQESLMREFANFRI
jgi:hypothetical protein